MKFGRRFEAGSSPATDARADLHFGASDLFNHDTTTLCPFATPYPSSMNTNT
jgi:hypothetical protein